MIKLPIFLPPGARKIVGLELVIKTIEILDRFSLGARVVAQAHAYS